MGYVKRLINKVTGTNSSATLGKFSAIAFTLGEHTTIHVSRGSMIFLVIEVEAGSVVEYSIISNIPSLKRQVKALDLLGRGKNLKYELIKEEGTHLFRIKALKNIDNLLIYPMIKKGDLGGLVEGRWNLEPKGNSWIDKDSMVTESGQVGGDSAVQKGACVQGMASVLGTSNIMNHSLVCGRAIVTDSLISAVDILHGKSIINSSRLNETGEILDENFKYVHMKGDFKY